MLVDLVCNYYSNKLGDPCKQQVGVQSPFVLCPASGNAKTVFEMVNGFFDIYPDFISGIPFVRTAEGPRIGAQVFLRIEIKHSAAGRFRAGGFAMADTPAFPGFPVVLPIHFRTDEFHGRDATAQMRFNSFPFHRERRIFRAAGDAILIERTIGFRKRQFITQRNICLLKRRFLKQVFIDFNGIESRIAQESFRVDQRVFPEEIF